MFALQEPKNHKESVLHDMRKNVRLLGDATAFDTPICSYETLGTCPAFEIESPIDCIPTFKVCAEGWTCTYHCNDNQVYNTYAQHCQDLDSCQKSKFKDDL